MGPVSQAFQIVYDESSSVPFAFRRLYIRVDGEESLRGEQHPY